MQVSNFVPTVNESAANYRGQLNVQEPHEHSQADPICITDTAESLFEREKKVTIVQSCFECASFFCPLYRCLAVSR